MSFFSAIRPSEIERPVLDLSGDILRAALQAMTVGSEAHGGIERYVDAVKLKSVMFGQVLVDRDVAELDLETFKGLCTFMATVRRRIGFWLNDESFEVIRGGLVELFDGADPVSEVTICGRFPMDKQHRWVRDLATETLHNTDPERFPLMNRWVWDATANTGVIREIWHGDDVDNLKIPVGDGYGTYLMLREGLRAIHMRTGRQLSAH